MKLRRWLRFQRRPRCVHWTRAALPLDLARVLVRKLSFCRVWFGFVGLHLASGSTALALDQELSFGWLVSTHSAEVLERSSAETFNGVGVDYGLRFWGPVWGRLGFDFSSAEGLSSDSRSRLELTRRSVPFTLGASWLLWQRLELGLSAGLSVDRLQEDLFPRGGGGGTVRTRFSGLGWLVAGTASVRLVGRLRAPAQLRYQRVRYDGGPVEISDGELSVRIGLSYRFGFSRKKKSCGIVEEQQN